MDEEHKLFSSENLIGQGESRRIFYLLKNDAPIDSFVAIKDHKKPEYFFDVSVVRISEDTMAIGEYKNYRQQSYPIVNSVLLIKENGNWKFKISQPVSTYHYKPENKAIQSNTYNLSADSLFTLHSNNVVIKTKGNPISQVLNSGKTWVLKVSAGFLISSDNGFNWVYYPGELTDAWYRKYEGLALDEAGCLFFYHTRGKFEKKTFCFEVNK